MGIWRTPAPRPDGLDRTDLAYGGPCYIAGYCPTSDHTIYAYLVEPKRDRDALASAEYATEMRGLAQGYGGFWPEIRATITDPGQVNYTWFDRLLRRPWHRGRVVLAGDAAHSCPPTLAQGAAMSLEDVAVLAELLTAHRRGTTRCLRRVRRAPLPRVELVVGASVQLGQWLLDGVRDADVPGLIGRIMTPWQPACLRREGIATMTERSLTHLRHVDLAVPDFDRQLDFYAGIWGLTRSRRHRDRVPGRRRVPSSTWSGSAGPTRNGSTWCPLAPPARTTSMPWLGGCPALAFG